MVTIDEEKQVVAVSQVLDEMKQAEENIYLWNPNACFYEKYTASTLPVDYLYYSTPTLQSEEQKKIDYDQASEISSGIPLRRVSLDDQYVADINEITWSNIGSKKASREIVFKNNGDIITSKIGNKKGIVSYKCSFNVLNNDFLFELDQKYDDKIAIKLEEHKYIIVCNNTTIIRDLETGIKEIYINGDKFRLELIYELRHGLKRGLLEVYKLHHGKKKINGTYRYSISPRNGLKMAYYTRKGKKKDMISAPYSYITDAHAIIDESFSPKTDLVKEQYRILLACEKLFLNARYYKIRDGNGYSFNGYGFAVDVKAIERKATEILSNIKGEVLLTGLTDRINRCLHILDNPLTSKNNSYVFASQTKKDD